MHINEGKGQLALFFYTANNVLLTPLLFIFFTFLLLHNFIVFVPQFFIPSSKISQFVLFSLLNLNFPPSPQFYYFPSSSSPSSSLLLFSLLHLILIVLIGSMWGRCRVDVGSMWGRCGVDVWTMWGRCGVNVGSK